MHTPCTARSSATHWKALTFCRWGDDGTIKSVQIQYKSAGLAFCISFFTSVLFSANQSCCCYCTGFLYFCSGGNRNDGRQKQRQTDRLQRGKKPRHGCYRTGFFGRLADSHFHFHFYCSTLSVDCRRDSAQCCCCYYVFSSVWFNSEFSVYVFFVKVAAVYGEHHQNDNLWCLLLPTAAKLAEITLGDTGKLRRGGEAARLPLLLARKSI